MDCDDEIKRLTAEVDVLWRALAIFGEANAEQSLRLAKALETHSKIINDTVTSFFTLESRVSNIEVGEKT